MEETRIRQAPGDRISREVADFYDRLGFPSRTSHPRYRTLLPARSGGRVGDFGCGQSLFHDGLRGHSPPPVFLDLSLPALRTIEHGHRVCADLRRLPFRSGSYERILCIGVLHHIPQRREVIDELARVVAPGGSVVLGVYAPGTLNARLRRLHRAARPRAWRALVAGLTAFLIRARHAMNGRMLGPDDVRRRTADFLDVPFVHFARPSEYEAEARLSGLRLQAVSRISAMNILHFERARTSPREGAGC